MKPFRLHVFALVLATTGLALGPGITPVQAQSDAELLESLVDSMRAELDRGEDNRLIDPWFLRDLRALLNQYDSPWDISILNEDFSDRSSTPPSPWEVRAGEWLVDWRYGLRSVIRLPQAQANNQQQTGNVNQLLGQILQGALTGNTQQQQQQQQPTYSAVVARVNFSNAFALNLDMTGRRLSGINGGRFEFGTMRGDDGTKGYRLVYTPDTVAGDASLELLKIQGSNRISTIAVYEQPLALMDGNPHSIQWLRDEDGNMAVSVDGAALLGGSDTGGFGSHFNGLVFINAGGDFALRQVTLDGVAYQ